MHTRDIFAGNAIVTLEDTQRMIRYTYRIKKVEDRPDQFFVGLLAGPDNTRDYQYIGMIRSGQFQTTKASQLPPESRPCKGIDWLLRHLDTLEKFPSIELHHAGHCLRCGRLLTVPTSISSGFGPECATR